MSDRDNGLRQTPWTPPFDTPGVGGTGLNGMGAGLSEGPGGNGIVQSPFSKAESAPGTSATASRDWPVPPDFTNVNGQDGGAGSQLPDDITPRKPGYTIDKR